MRAIDGDLPVTDFEAIGSAVEGTTSAERFRALLLGIFGALALALAAAGVFGVLSYSVVQRMREMGIRLALGATPATLRHMVLWEAGALATAGLVAGTATAILLARLLQGELYGVTASDPRTYVTTAVVLLTVALAAGYLPARRAMRVDPVVALRADVG